jgi:hypothetical protein
LIIEELSRANASLVFGDMLQLLDRSDDAAKAGWSPYGLRPKPEVRDYYLIENGVDVGSDGEMKFPPNLFIWETMNRSDQNARQLDAAFLRRWEKRYLSHRTKSDHGDLLDPTPVGDIRWDVLRSLINDALLKLRIPEDKLVGPYFSKKASLSSRERVADDLLGYLWNDVLRTQAREFFAPSLPSLADVIRAWTTGSENSFAKLELKAD